jgi:hypothetical protein
MIVTSQPKKAETDRSPLALAVGADNGHGLLKLTIDGSSNQMRVRCPSKFKQVRDDLIDYPTSKHGSIFYYHEGDNSSLKGQEWRTGELAYTADPTGHTKLSDNPQNKIDYALHAILGALGTLPYRQRWNLHLVCSIHNSKLFANELIKATEGTHVVSFNGKSSPQSFVNIRVSLIVPEGAGSYAHCRAEGLIDHTKHAIALDFGTGTIIATVFAPGGAIEHREVLSVGGCIDLLEALARDQEIQLFEGGKTGDIELIRQGIENRTFRYGNTSINFEATYKQELMPWLKDRFSLGFKAVSPWRKLAESFVIWGGGAQLPGLAAAVEKYRYKAIQDGCWANAIGLQRLAEARLSRGK